MTEPKYNEKFYAFTFKDNKDETLLTLNSSANKVVLIVNVASKCGYTKQYTPLQALYETYKDQGFEILGFPCNQFGGQEPGDNKKIAEFCQVQKVTFPLMDKSDVNGKNANPVFEYLKGEALGIFRTKAIKWNFTKFLIDRYGNVVARYSPNDDPKSFENKIKELLDTKVEQ